MADFGWGMEQHPTKKQNLKSKNKLSKALTWGCLPHFSASCDSEQSKIQPLIHSAAEAPATKAARHNESGASDDGPYLVGVAPVSVAHSILISDDELAVLNVKYEPDVK